MRRVIYRDIKSEIARLAGTSGYQVTDPRLLTRINKAVEELINEGDWAGVVDRYNFAAYDGYITLPADFERIVGLAANYTPKEVKAPWYEFAADGPGPQDAFSGVDGVLDRGQTCTFRQAPNSGGPYFLRVYANKDERIAGIRPKMIVQGYDQNGQWVRGTDSNGDDIDGLEVELNGDSLPRFIQTPFGWSQIESVIKPATKGYVEFWLWDGEEEYNIASYAPRETRPSYRSYFIPSLSELEQHYIQLRARLRFQPIVGDNDWLLISNLNALESMMLGLQKRETGDLAAYAGYKAIAVDILKKEAIATFGKNRRPTITFSSDFGMGAIPHCQ